MDFPINLPNHLFMAISFKLMAIKIVGNEVEHFTAINFTFHFIKLLKWHQGQFLDNQYIQIHVSNCFYRQ